MRPKGTPGANVLAREADLIIGIGTRYSDFTTASKTAFQNPAVRFLNVNVAEFDAYKHASLPLVADARATLEELSRAVASYLVDVSYRARIDKLRGEWEKEVDRIYSIRKEPPITQGEVIGAVNEITEASDVIVCAAGSLPGDLHKLWRTRRPGNYHLEYGYSCMGYEIAGGLGVKMAKPESEVYVMVGDGSYLMMSQEIVTSLQEGCKLNIVLLDNMGTNYRYRRGDRYDGELLSVDFQANASSLGAWAVRARTSQEFRKALCDAKKQTRTSVVVVETSYDDRVPGYESWWDVPIAEVSERETVKAARTEYEKARAKERLFF